MVNGSHKDQLALTEGEWVPIPRISRVIPFGYKVSEDDPDLLLPVPLELEALEKAKQHIKQFSYRDVAQWLTAVTGRYISHMGLRKRLEVERHRRRKSQAIKRWAKGLEEALQRVEKYEKGRIGAKAEG